MEHRLPPPDLQRQVEECLAIYLRSSSTSAREVADALVQIAYHRHDNPVKSLFRHAAQGAAAPPPCSTGANHPLSAPAEEIAPPLSASVRPKGSKLSLRFGRKGDRDKPSTDLNSASATDGNSWRKHFRPGTALDRSAGPPLPEHQHNASIDTNASAGEHPEYVRNLIAHGFLDKDDVPPHKARPESRNGQLDAVDEKRGFFTFNSSGKGGKVKTKVEPEATASSSSSAEYSCVFCEKNDKTYSSKGTCKRHLEEMHVAKKYLQCNECHHKSNTVPDARKHAAQCSSKMVGWTNVKPGPKKFYSSEFAQSLVFESQQLYVEHLLELCGKPFDQRPRLSWHTKLRNLLEKEFDREYLQDTSRRMIGSPDAWRNARWDFDRLHRACRELEFGILDHELDPGDLLRLRRRKAFLEELFAARLPEATSSSAGSRGRPQKIEEPPPPTSFTNTASNASTDPAPVYQSQAPAESQQMMTLANGYNHATNTYFTSPPDHRLQESAPQEAPPKRPLSYETASSVPLRIPPGPSPATFQTDDGPAYRDVYSEPFRYPVQQNTSMGTISPAFTSSPWPMQDQPPPYDQNFVTAATSYPTPLQSAQAVTESLELPAANLSLPEQYGQVNLQSTDGNHNLMDLYNSAPTSIPTNMSVDVPEQAMFDNFAPPTTTAQEQAQWSPWYHAGQNNTTYSTFSGHFGNGP
ncbi:hypothetical protein Tdes44962_MAKER09775 [Teratosphaeria destructans]|uniref:Uncharacterized protein n=1 Tax=Teratosphaeria destructans TaxID=418781 RepID=A0A9W7W240_9PEZI|nr:hypothetical protein Tdes44962_MAKER09775 [Teratosphaeria destructans]